MIVPVMVALSATFMVGPAAGFAQQPGCYEPDPPWCLNSSLKTDYEFDSCRSEMESYVREVNNYVRCLDRAQDAAIRESNDAVRRFNCKAKGSSFCY
jgi:hypothetical protein